MFKQCKFYDEEQDVIGGGIIDYDTNRLICACCGSVFPLEKLEELGITVLKVYDEWVDFHEEIIG